MLLRAYRVTDRLGVVILKSLIALVDATLDGLTIFWHGIAAVLLRVWRVLRFILRPFVALAVLLIDLLLRLSGQTTLTARRQARDSMARRAARAEMGALVQEDPLRAQNRTLSLLTVVLLVVLVGVVLWATNPARTPKSAGLFPNAGAFDPSVFATAQPQNQPTVISLIASPVPTVTPLPSVLEVRGSLAYVARENGQTDIWVVPVGSRTPLRITNSPQDERDPAWSPDGTQIAYASRQDGNWELYLYTLADGTTTRLTYDLSFQGKPSWSPDGLWLAYESYQGGNLDIVLLRVDGSQQPIRLPGNSSAPDFSPAWSPDGRRIAFVSWREGNQDIYLFSLDDQSVVNLTRTPTRHEDYPAWSPDGELIAYSAVDEGLEKVFVKATNNLDAPAQALDRGRMPSWSPDGASLVFAVDSIDGGQLIASPFAGSGVVTTIIPVPRRTAHPVWTAAPLPISLINSGGLRPAITTPLFVEQQDARPVDPPYRLTPLIGVNVENALLSDRVNDSFNALREATLSRVGWDFLGRLDDAFWRIDRPPQPGEERRNWLMTGRAFSLTRGSILGVPPPIEIVREDLGVDTLWRVYVRAAQDAQNGELGEPLRRMPWDLAARTQGDVEAYDQGGRLRSAVPSGYYIDFTQLAEDYGWERAPAGSDWRANANSINYWSFRKTDGLTWFAAMREIYTEPQLGGFAPTAAPAAQTPTPLPTQPVIFPTFTPPPTRGSGDGG